MKSQHFEGFIYIAHLLGAMWHDGLVVLYSSLFFLFYLSLLFGGVTYV